MKRIYVTLMVIFIVVAFFAAFFVYRIQHAPENNWSNPDSVLVIYGQFNISQEQYNNSILTNISYLSGWTYGVENRQTENYSIRFYDRYVVFQEIDTYYITVDANQSAHNTPTIYISIIRAVSNDTGEVYFSEAGYYPPDTLEDDTAQIQRDKDYLISQVNPVYAMLNITIQWDDVYWVIED